MKKCYRRFAGIVIFALLVLSGLLLSGCGSGKKEVLELSDLSELSELKSRRASPEDLSGPEEIHDPQDSEKADSGGEPAETEQAEGEAGEKELKLIYVYLCGAVVQPGVYEVPEGTRLFRVLQLAGGLKAGAAPEALNQAEILVDGSQIRVPTREEWEKDRRGTGTDSAASGGVSGGKAGSGGMPGQDSLVNINTASAAELMTLNGIGAARAAAIISWREEHGGFSSVEDIKKVTGIKDGLFEKIRGQIRV